MTVLLVLRGLAPSQDQDHFSASGACDAEYTVGLSVIHPNAMFVLVRFALSAVFFCDMSSMMCDYPGDNLVFL